MDDFHYPSCFGDHAWNPFYDPFSRFPLMICGICGMMQRVYGHNFEYYKGPPIQMVQQSWNLRPFKPFFDVNV